MGSEADLDRMDHMGLFFTASQLPESRCGLEHDISEETSCRFALLLPDTESSDYLLTEYTDSLNLSYLWREIEYSNGVPLSR